MPNESKISPASRNDAAPLQTIESVATELGFPGSRLAPKRWMKWARRAMAAVVIVGLVLAIERSLEHWNQQPEKERLYLSDLRQGWLAMGALLYAAALLPATWVLARSLRSLGVSASIKSVMAAQLVGHLAKYVPGKAMVVIVRAAMLNRGGTAVSIRAATIAISIETLTLIATGATLAFAMLVLRKDAMDDLPEWIKPASVLMALGAAAATLPAVLRLVLSRRMIGGTLPFTWTLKDVLATWALNLLTWMLVAASASAIVLSLPSHTMTETPSMIVIFATCLTAVTLAQIVGFLSLLPGGAGVREIVFAALMAPMVGPSGALLIAILIRLVQIAVEVCVAGPMWLLSGQTNFSEAADWQNTSREAAVVDVDVDK